MSTVIPVNVHKCHDLEFVIRYWYLITPNSIEYFAFYFENLLQRTVYSSTF